MLILVAGAGRIVEVDVDVRNHFAKEDPHIVALERLEETYALSDTALVAIAPESGSVFTREALVAIEDLTEQLWQTPYATRIDSIANYSHSQGRGDELIVEPLVDNASTLGDSDIDRIRDIALATEEVASFPMTDGLPGLLSASRCLTLIGSRRNWRSPTSCARPSPRPGRTIRPSTIT